MAGYCSHHLYLNITACEKKRQAFNDIKQLGLGADALGKSNTWMVTDLLI